MTGQAAMPDSPANSGQNILAINSLEFEQLRKLLYTHSGISLASNKVALAQNRLSRHVYGSGYASLSAYLKRIAAGDTRELQMLIDLLTTNETSFFREPRHFDFLRELVTRRPPAGRAFRVWSAACSTGEEPYSLAMTLMDTLGTQTAWEVVASDISARVLATAQSAHYAMERATTIPPALLKKYCLKGVRAQAGSLLIAPEIRQRITFRRINLVEPLPGELGQFDVILLRNVLIYFDNSTKKKIVSSLVNHLYPEGHFLTSHTESLYEITDLLKSVKPSVYRKPAATRH